MKYLFCDLDGTLLHDFHRVDLEDIAALQRAQEQGVKISIATGRLDYEIKMFMEQYGLSGFRVSQNGGVVYNEKNEVLHKELLTNKEIEIILVLDGRLNITLGDETYTLKNYDLFITATHSILRIKSWNIHL